MKKILKKITVIFSVLIVILSVMATAYASSYTTSYNFTVANTGPTRYFDGTNIRFISPYATSIPYKSTLVFNYTVSLYRDKLIDDFIGTKTLYRDTYGVANWSNV
jgi:hypothetical protein